MGCIGRVPQQINGFLPCFIVIEWHYHNAFASRRIDHRGLRVCQHFRDDSFEFLLGCVQAQSMHCLELNEKSFVQIATIQLYRRFSDDATQLLVGKAAMLCVRKMRRPVDEVPLYSEGVAKRADSLCSA